MRGHQGRVYCVAFDPPGKRLASCGEDGTVRIWEAHTGKAIGTLHAADRNVYAIAWNSDGQLLATAGEDGTIRLWNATTLEPAGELGNQRSSVTMLSFAPNGQMIGSSDVEGAVLLRDVNGRREVRRLAKHRHTVHAIAFSADGSQVYSACEDGTVQISPVAPAEPSSILWKSDGRVYSLAESPNRKHLAVAAETGFQLFDLETGEQRIAPIVHRNTVRALAFSVDGRLLASASDDQTMCIWDVDTLEVCCVFRGHIERIYHLAISPTGLLASSGKDGTVRTWRIDLPQERYPIAKVSSGLFTDIEFTSDGEFLSAALWGSEKQSSVSRWDATTGELVLAKPLAPHSATARSAVAEQNKALLVSAGDKVLRWNLNNDPLEVVGKLPMKVVDIAVAPGGDSVAVADDRSAVLGPATAHGEWTALPGLRCVAFSPDGKLIAMESAHSQFGVELWNVPRGRSKATLERHEGQVNQVAFSGDNQYLASASSDGTAKLWKLVEDPSVRTLRGHAAQVRSVVFHPDGTRLATASSDGTVIVWDVATAQPLLTLPVQADGHVRRVAFSPDGQLLATASDNTEGARIDLWSAIWNRPSLDVGQE
jgi:WD40 repeat protein